MRVEVSPDRLVVSPGVPQPVTIAITNPGEVIGGYTVRILGVDPSWVQLDGGRISLFPQETKVLTALVTVPAGLAAGDRSMAVQVRELTPPEASAVNEIVLEVPAAPDVRVRVDPPVVTGGRNGRFSLLIDNTGNTVLSGALAAADSEDKLRYTFEPAQLELAPGQHAVVDLRARGRRPFTGAPLVRTLDLHLVEGAVETQPGGVGAPTEEGASPRRGAAAPVTPSADARPVANATFVQTALLSRGPLSLVGLLVAVTVFAIVITLALSRLVGQSAADRNLALEIASANQDGGGGVGTSGLSGTVRMLTSGEGAPNVSVDIFAADNPNVPLVSKATAADGTYSATGLPAGDYKISYRGAGFVPTWFPAAIDPANAEAVTLADNNQVTGLDVSLGGVPASMQGTVVGDDVSDATVALRTPSALAPAGVGVTAAPVPGDPGDGATVATTPVGSDGAFSLANVPSPAIYDLVVTKKGYATSTQRIDVGAGEARKNISVTLSKGNGIISGKVASPSGALGGVTLTATAGQTVVSTVSLTKDQPGTFALRRLPTPGTYTLVASKDGFASQTITVTLADGQTLTGVAMTLSKSSGSLSGRATLTKTGKGAGGVSVTVSDGTRTVQTATQSVGDVGAWAVSGLTLPGTYTVTLTRPDLETQTVSVSLGSSGQVTPDSRSASVTGDGLLVAMRSSTTSIAGVVTQPDEKGVVRKVGEVTVELTSGTSTYTVTTASVPSDKAGEYQIDQVPPGTYTISFSRPGVSPTSDIVQLRAGEPYSYPARLAQAASVTGTISGASAGSGFKGYVVEIYRASGYPSVLYRSTTTTDAAGSFSFYDVDAPEAYVVQVRRTRGSAPLGSKTVQVKASGSPDVTIKVSK